MPKEPNEAERPKVFKELEGSKTTKEFKRPTKPETHKATKAPKEI